MDRMDRIVKMEEDYISVDRVAVLMHGLGGLLQQPPFSLAEAWKPYALQCLNEPNE
jgi:hypothetical protein